MKKYKIACISIIIFLISISLAFAKDTVALRANIIEEGKKFLGVPYVWGGTSIKGMDCSGFVFVTVKEATNISLPRTAEDMYQEVLLIPISLIEKGDLVFFKDGESISHVAIYMGNNQIIHAPSEGPQTGVIISSLNEKYWKNHLFAIGQILPSTGDFNNYIDSSTATVAQHNRADNKTIEKKRLADCNAILDLTGHFSWNFFNKDAFKFDILGGTAQAHIKYNGKVIEPGFGLEVRISADAKKVQVPLYLSLGFSHGFKVYGGTYFDFDVPQQSASTIYKASTSPAIFGAEWQTPSLNFERFGISLVQDISWLGALKPAINVTPFDHFANGVAFSTGLRFSIGF